MLNVGFRSLVVADQDLPANLASESEPLTARALRYVDENHPAVATWANGRFTHRMSVQSVCTHRAVTTNDARCSCACYPMAL